MKMPSTSSCTNALYNSLGSSYTKKVKNNSKTKGEGWSSVWRFIDNKLRSRGDLPIKAYTGRLHLKGVPFLGLTEVYKRVEISLVEVYERVGKSVISVCKNAKTGWQMHFRAVKESTKLCDLFIFKINTIHLQQLKGMQSSKLGLWKGYIFSIESIRKWYVFCQKWYIKG